MGGEYSTKQWEVHWNHVAQVNVIVDSSVNARVHYPVPELAWKFSEQVGYRKFRRTPLAEVA